MLFLLSHTHQRVDATLRHYLVRGTRTGERSRQFDRLVSTSTVTTEPPRGPASPEDVEFGTSIDAEARRVERLDAEFPGAAARLTASRVLADFPRRSAPDKALATDPKAGAWGGAGGAEEFTVIVKTSRAAADGDAFGSRALRRVCELKRAIERSPGYGGACTRVKEKTATKNQTHTPASASSENDRDGCAPAFSAFDVVSAYEHVGLRGVPLAFARTARAVLMLNDGIDSVRRVCSSRETAGGVLCGLRPSLGCDPRGCDAKLNVTARACVVGNGLVEVCDWIRSAAPTEEEVKTVAWADFRQSTSSQDEGCEKGSFDPASAASAIKFGAVAARWSERSGGTLEMAALAAPWSLLADRRFGEAGADGDDDARARARTEVTRLAFRLAPKGTPGYAAATRWAKEVAGPIVESWGDGEMTASWRHMWALKLMGREYLWGDLRWAAGSFCTTLFLVRAHTGSTFLALGGMTAVIASLVVAQFVYVHAIGVTWIGMLNFLGVFIVLGVGADDVFVILEFWKQSKREALSTAGEEDDRHSDDGESSTERVLVERLRWTAEKSLYVVTMTSVTTAAAFACNMASRIAPVRLFGAFMAALIAGNYLLVCTTFPALLVLEHGMRARSARRWRRWRNRARVRATRLESVVVAPAHPVSHHPVTHRPAIGPRTSPKHRRTASHAPRLAALEEDHRGIEIDPPSASKPAARRTSSLTLHDRLGVFWRDGGGRDSDDEDDFSSLAASSVASSASQSPVEALAASMHATRRAYEERGEAAVRVLADFVVSYRWHVVALAAAALAFSAFAARGIQPPARSSSAGFSIFPEGHNFNVFAEACSLFGFARSAEAVRVTFVWGLERPRETDPADGEFAPSHLTSDPRNPLGARALEETARRLGSKFENPTTSDQERAAVPVFDPSFDATSEEAQAWMLSFCRDLRGSEATARRLKDPNSVVCFAEDVEDATRAASGGGFGSPMSPARYGAALRRYGRGESNDGAVRWFAPDRSGTPPAPGRGGPTLTNIPADIGGSNEGRVASVAVTAVLKTSSVSSSTAELVAEHEFWEGWFESKLAGAPPGLRGGFQTSPTWTLTETETELVDGAWTALTLSLVFAFVVLLGASRSVRLALLATISVGSSAASLLAAAALLGWTMGVIEAVCTMVLVGLSLDYVLHVAGAYVRTSGADGRRERAKGAVRAVGLSVVSGASTTVGAAAFLLGCTLPFFTKFGLFVAWTLTSSLVQAVVVFPAMCAVWGPEDVERVEGEEDEQEGWRQTHADAR